MQNTAAACDGTSSVFQFGKTETILANTADRAGARGATRYVDFLKQIAAAACKALATPTPERKRSWSSPTLSSPQTPANHGPTLALSIQTPRRMNTCTVNAMWATSSPMSAPLRPCGRPFRHHLHHHRRRDKLIAGMGTTSSPKSRSLMPYGWLFHQHLHRQAGNGSLPPSAPKTPPTYAQMTSHTGNGSLPLSAPKTPPTNAKMHLRCQLHQLQLLTSSILYNHHGSGGSCVVWQYG